MNQVKVFRSTLLEKIKANRDAHRDTFLKAQSGYREEVIAELDRMLQEARDNKPIRRLVELPEPQDHTSDYDRAIAMLEMSVDEHITVAAHEFESYVLDNWDWKVAVSATNMRYLKKAIA